jgi:hypothetical protein
MECTPEAPNKLVGVTGITKAGGATLVIGSDLSPSAGMGAGIDHLPLFGIDLTGLLGIDHYMSILLIGLNI